MAIESNLWNSLPWRTQGSLSRDPASSLVFLKRVCRQWISSSAQHPVAVVQGNGICAGLNSTSCWGRTPCRRHNPRLRTRGWLAHPLIRVEIKSPDSVLSSIFAPQHQRRSTRPVRVARTRRLLRVFFSDSIGESARLCVKSFFVWQEQTADERSATQSYDEHCRSGGTCDDRIGGFSK